MDLFTEEQKKSLAKALKLWIRDAELTDKDLCFEWKEKDPTGFKIAKFDFGDGLFVYARYLFGDMLFEFDLVKDGTLKGVRASDGLEEVEFTPADDYETKRWWQELKKC